MIFIRLSLPALSHAPLVSSAVSQFGASADRQDTTGDEAGLVRQRDDKVKDLARRALDLGFRAFKLKVGSKDPDRDVRRANMLRELVGPDALVMLDINQQWTLPQLAGISEFLAVSLLARKYGLPVVPHVGDMGQIHQHLVLFNHIALGHDALFLEYIPHVRDRFVHPAVVEGGVYRTPEAPGCSCDMVGLIA